MPLFRFKMALVLTLILAAGGPASVQSADAPLDYNRQIRPILSNNCLRCHGPDTAERESGLRLDVRDEALKPAESGKRAIVPGKPDASRLIERINSTDPGEVMPPPETNKKLTDAEKELLRRWIAEGAPYQVHWSFVTPRRPPVPQVKQTAWPRNAIDSFLLARLEAEGLKPARPADRETLIRRVTLDLTGLPPTSAQVDAFLADARDDAYEQVVDRLLSSPHYGERMAVDWLDAARFADTHGYHIDSGRDMTRWREWVIDAFNRNQPFDQFTVEQLAGDLLPDATREQQIASGFNRNHMINFEGGAIPEEYHTAYIIDRVNTTGTVWLGLTVGCAQCHDHKFDPLTQRDFYGLYAFFHNVPENGLDGSKGNAAPLVKAPTSLQQRQLDKLAASIGALEQQLNGPSPALDAAQAAWEQTAVAVRDAWKVLDPRDFRSKGGATFKKLDDRSLVVSGENPAVETYEVTAPIDLRRVTGLKLEALPDDSLAARGPGRSSNGNIVLTNIRVTAAAASDPNATGREIKLWSASADYSQSDYPVTQAIDADPHSGWAIYPEVGKPHFAVFEFQETLKSETDLLLRVTIDFQSQSAQHQLGRFRLSVTSEKDPHATQGPPEKIVQILAVAAADRSESQRNELRTFYRTKVDPPGRTQHEQLENLRASLTEIEKGVSTTMVMQEMPLPRDTYLLIRGQYDKKGDKVTATVPAALGALAADAPHNRLGLAQWLVAPDHPLTARVTVNRYWQMFFGTALVKTTEDFGSQGDSPSHPELLDWLAVEFREPTSTPLLSKTISPPLTKGGQGGSADAVSEPDSTDTPNATPPNPPLQRGGTQSARGGVTGWNVKALVRLIVTSAAYRQSAVVPRELYARDPENRLLARGPRFRLQAEFIRDQALAVSGLLDSRIGGKSVSPYQPPGLWEELMSRADGKNWSAQSYEQSHGPDLYRRTMYTFWKRTCPPPTLATFDAPDRETCTVRRARTNTPLQALVLLNDPTYVEAARKFAERILTEGGKTTNERLSFAFRSATARRPAERELAVLQAMLAVQLAKYRANRADAQKLLKVGESPHDETLDSAELAAWATIAGAILNLDEVVTRG